MNKPPCPGRIAGQDPGSTWLIIWGLESGKNLIFWSDAASSFALQTGKAMGCAPHSSATIGRLLDGLCSFLCALVRYPGWVD